MFRSMLIPSIFLGASLALSGCMVDTAESVEDTSTQSSALSAAAKKLKGSYSTGNPSFGGFAQLKLKGTGKYTALRDGGGTVFCVTSPCWIPESGSWKASSSQGEVYLSLKPTGGSWEEYLAVKKTNLLLLTQDGATQGLAKVDQGECIIDQDCGSDEYCPPQMCLMACLVDDPACCAPSTCEPKEEPEQCFGAWLDQFGTCRTPVDGVYPDYCCAGEPCGPTHCAEGTVCCNSLDGICVPPGGVCAF